MVTLTVVFGLYRHYRVWYGALASWARIGPDYTFLCSYDFFSDQHNIADVMGVSEVLLCPYCCLEYKKAVLPQGNRAMPQVYFSVEVRQQHSLQV